MKSLPERRLPTCSCGNRLKSIKADAARARPPLPKLAPPFNQAAHDGGHGRRWLAEVPGSEQRAATRPRTRAPCRPGNRR
eukprot:4705005-Pyramimonas_sp.AAC.1